MPRGDKGKYTSKQKRQAEHIEEGVKKRGGSSGEAARIAWATVNKQDHGGKQGGSGTGRVRDTSPSKKGGRKSQSARTAAERSEAGRKAARTRKRNASSTTGTRRAASTKRTGRRSSATRTGR